MSALNRRKRVHPSDSNNLNASVQYLKGIGEKRARQLKEVEVHTILDLLYYFPRRYLDRSHVTKIRDLREDQEATVVVKVRFGGLKAGRGGRQRFLLGVSDGTGELTCVWFNRPQYWASVFRPGEAVAFSGKVTVYGGFQLVHPEFDKLSQAGESDFLHTGRIIPLYPSTEALTRVGLDSRGFRRAIRRALQRYAYAIPETLPEAVRRRQKLVGLRQALENVHFPESRQALAQARKRLKFDELFYLELMLAYRRRRYATLRKGIEFMKVGDRTRKLIESLPFDLTEAQKRVIREIRDDMKKDAPMNRLLQGDVGSGKTVVALISMMLSIENGYQAALMAPTEILAEQHYLTMRPWLEELGIEVVLLIGALKGAGRKAALEKIATGAADIVIGTHALIQEGVTFHKLGLVIIDEQHRFGVVQRATLVEKGLTPDVLVMTATPIPRTLALTLHGDLDVSTIDELPPGRNPVKTYWRSEDKRDQIYAFVRERLAAGEQAYVVFPLIEESEKIDLKAAIANYEALRRGPFRDFEVGLLHGRMKSEEKEAVMQRFKAGELQVLVSTTVVEVGVDVPNATIMVIENAERFGLPQLHQLRGRVGRGERPAVCFLISAPVPTADARKRLRTLTETHDGFQIAEVDLQLRGPGEFFGTRQSGLPKLRIADLVKDTELLLQARDEAFRLAEQDQQLLRFENMPVRSHFFKNYRDKFDLAQIG